MSKYRDMFYELMAYIEKKLDKETKKIVGGEYGLDNPLVDFKLGYVKALEEVLEYAYKIQKST